MAPILSNLLFGVLICLMTFCSTFFMGFCFPAFSLFNSLWVIFSYILIVINCVLIGQIETVVSVS